MKRKLIAAAAIILLAGLSYFAWQEYKSQTAQSALLTGTIEATKADITPKASGYLDELPIKEGQPVHAGDLAAKLSRRDLEAAALRDRAAYESAAANLTKLQNGNRTEDIEAARSEEAAALAASDKAAKDFARMDQLFSADAISKKDYDAALEARDAAAANLAAASERRKLLEAGSRTEDIAIAQHTKDQYAAALAMSESAVDDLSVYAPISGVILTKNYEPGEYVAAGAPIATIADLSDVWVKVYVSSEELG